MAKDFSDFDVDDIYYGADTDDDAVQIKADATGADRSDKPETAASQCSGPGAGDGSSRKPEATATAAAGSAANSATAKDKAQQRVAHKSRGAKAKTMVQLMAILLLLALNAAQLMGIAYRDMIDKGWPTSSAERVFANLAVAKEAPPAGDTAPATAATATPATAATETQPKPKEAASNVGVASTTATATPPEAKAPVPPKREENDDAKTSAAANTAKASAAPTPQTPSSPTSTPPPAAAPTKPAKSGTHAVAVGIFRSQRHVLQMKRDLNALSLPYFTRVKAKKGEGFVLRSTDSASALDAAKAALADKGYNYIASGNALTAYFHYEDEAAKALTLLKAAGSSATVKPISGEIPRWEVLVGPMSSSQASDAGKKLHAAKIDNYLLRISK